MYIITETKTKTLFTFDELNEHGKQKAAWNYLDSGCYNVQIDDKIALINADCFPNSDSKWEWTFNFSQGDGANVYGDIAYNDLAKLAGIPQLRYMDLEWIEAKANWHYTYCNWTRYSGVWWNIVDTLRLHFDDEEFKRYTDIISNWADSICDAVQGVCDQLQKYGEDLALDLYENPDYYEGELFDECGNFACYEWDLPETPAKSGEGSIDDLTPEQLEELTESALFELWQALDLAGDPSYGDISDANEIVSPALLHLMYGDMRFTRDDFFCTVDTPATIEEA